MDGVKLPGRSARAEEVYDHIKAAILSGEMPPGHRLVEQTLAAALGVSRTPVREAIARLQIEGLARSDARGVSVIALTDAELLDLCVAREALEGVAARFAAQHITDVEVQALERLQLATEDAVETEDLPRLVELNHAFHTAVWRAARNRFLAKELAHLRGLIERLQATTLGRRSRQWEALAEHNELLDALKRGDATAAEQLTRRHFGSATALRLAQQTTPAVSGSWKQVLGEYVAEPAIKKEVGT